jgi:purine-nucleoside phosphorylase
MTGEWVTADQIDAAAECIRGHTRRRPRVGLILGSGLGPLADEIQDADHIPFATIPNFPVSTVLGHSGRLVVGRLEGQAVLAMQGRAHYYEGYSMAQLTLPIRVMQALGMRVLIVTNAAGGLNLEWQAGDLMLITDHINLIGMTGLNPLRGPNLEQFGPRFPDMSEAYDPELRGLAREVARENGILLREGVYTGLAGPSFETPAELRFLRSIGSDAVGMSTVAETTVARHGDMRVLGLSGISNIVVYEPSQGEGASHEEVLEAGKQIVPKLITVIKGTLQRLEQLDRSAGSRRNR